MRKWNKLLSISMLSILSIGTTFSSLSALSKDELEQKKYELNQLSEKFKYTKQQKELLLLSKSDLEKEISNNISKIDDLVKQLNNKISEKSSTKLQLATSVSDLNSLKENINQNTKDIISIKSKIDDLNNDINIATTKLASKKDELKNTFKYLQKANELQSFLTYLTDAESFNGFIQKYKAVESISHQQKDIIQKYIDLKNKLDNKKKNSEKLQQEFINKSNTLLSSKAIIEDKINVLQGKSIIEENQINQLTSLKNDNSDQLSTSNLEKSTIDGKIGKLNGQLGDFSKTIEQKTYDIDVYSSDLSEKEQADALIRSQQEEKIQQQQDQEAREASEKQRIQIEAQRKQAEELERIKKEQEVNSSINESKVSKNKDTNKTLTPANDVSNSTSNKKTKVEQNKQIEQVKPNNKNEQIEQVKPNNENEQTTQLKPNNQNEQIKLDNQNIEIKSTNQNAQVKSNSQNNVVVNSNDKKVDSNNLPSINLPSSPLGALQSTQSFSAINPVLPALKPSSTKPSSANTKWFFPKTCHNITESYGEYHPELYGSYDGGYHHAVDYACGFGTNIFAPTNGKIVELNYDSYGYGTHIVFATNYNGHQIKLVIGHLSNVNVYKGQVVKPGQILGSEGSTGNSTGPHTHFELWQDNVHINPSIFWGL